MVFLWTLISNEHFWLAKNTTWKHFTQLEQEENIDLPHITDLLYVYPLAGVLYVIRVLFEQYVAKPIGRSLGIGDINARKATKGLNQTYRQKVTSTDSGSSSSIIRHLRVSPLTKFSESCWRFAFYLSVFIYGILILQNKSWTWDTRHLWLNYPNQPLTTDIFWYYMIELAFYWSLLFSQFIDTKRKDFWQMFFHHIATIVLLSISYIGNYVRAGSIVLVIHDCADYWLEGGKMAVYARKKRLHETMFVIFAVVWFVTRLCYFPYKTIYTITFEGRYILGPYPPALHILNGLLLLLYILHWIWFYHICQVAIAAFKTSKMSDVRSDSEDSNDELIIRSGDGVNEK